MGLLDNIKKKFTQQGNNNKTVDNQNNTQTASKPNNGQWTSPKTNQDYSDYVERKLKGLKDASKITIELDDDTRSKYEKEIQNYLDNAKKSFKDIIQNGENYLTITSSITMAKVS